VKRRVLLLIKGLGRGGAEQILASAAPHFDRDRFEYHAAYVLPWKGALVKDLEDAGVPTHCLGVDGKARWVARLRGLVRDLGTDLVHAHSPVPAAAARTVLRGRRLRTVYTEHNAWERYHPLTRWANAITFERNDQVFAVSDHVRASIRYPRALSGRRMPPVETLYHGIDLDSIRGWADRNGIREELGIAPDAPVVGTVANLKTHKRLDRLLSAAVVVRREVPDVRFVLVGQGPLEAELRATSRELGLDDVVVFTGFREDAPRVTSTFDVFALTSEHEGLSIALIEALSLGKPCVVTSVGGLTEVIEGGKQGVIVPEGDVASIAGGIIRLIRDPQLRAEMGEAGRERAQIFDIRRSVDRMETVYGELLS
jgi:glycosyltransferase involved in cell wall biosynthesis